MAMATVLGLLIKAVYCYVCTRNGCNRRKKKTTEKVTGGALISASIVVRMIV